MQTPVVREKRAVLINSFSNVLYFFIQVAVVFFASPILVHGLGDSQYAAWLLVNSVLGYMALAELGIGASVVRYVSRFDGLSDHEAINRIFSTSLIIFSCAGALVLIVVLPLAVLWHDPFGVQPEVAREMRWLFALLGTNLAISLPLGLYKSVIAGLARYPTVNALRVMALLLRNVLFVCAIHFGGGLREIGLAITVSSLLYHAGAILAAHYYLPTLRFSLRLVNRETSVAIRGYSGYVFLTIIVCNMSSGATLLIVGAVLAPVAVTYMGIAFALVNYAGDGLRTTIAVLTPTVSKWDAMGAEDSIARLLVTGTRYLLFLTMPLLIGMLFMGRQFIAMWMGERYAEHCYPALAILVVPLPLALAQAMGSRILEGIGKVGQLFWLNVVYGLLAIGGSIALVKPLGIEGVALAASAALIAQSIGVVALACRATRVNISSYILRSWAKPILAAVILAAAWLLALWYLPPVSTWTSFLGTGLVAMALYFSLVLWLDTGLWSLVRRFSVPWMPQSAQPENV